MKPQRLGFSVNETLLLLFFLILLIVDLFYNTFFLLFLYVSVSLTVYSRTSAHYILTTRNSSHVSVQKLLTPGMYYVLCTYTAYYVVYIVKLLLSDVSLIHSQTFNFMNFLHPLSHLYYYLVI